jgi:hypothetical protein
MNKLGKNQIGNYICAFMCLLVLITQFLPFWNCTNCKTHKENDKMVSVSEYIWIPVNHTPITKSMTNVYYEAFGEGLVDANGKPYKFSVNDIYGPCVVTFVGSVVGIVLSILFSRYAIVSLVTLVVGCSAARWYLICPAMQVGQNWQIHLACAMIAAIIAGLVILSNVVIPYIHKFVVPYIRHIMANRKAK